MTPEQCRMARAALNWSAQKLADAAGVGRNTINRFEAGGDARLSSVGKVQATLEGAGIVFIPQNGGGPGVRLRSPVAIQQTMLED